MIALWMLYVLATSLLVSAAAAAGEASLRRLGRPARWVWVAAIAGSLALAVAPWLTEATDAPAEAAGVSMPVYGTIIDLPALDVGSDSLLNRLDAPLLALWAGGTLAVLATLAGGALALARRRRRWSAAQLDGRSVLLSDDFGPAVVGLLRPGVVLPRWVAALEPAARGMVLLHEEEHRRAGDVPLLVAGAALVAALPWNAALWLQLRGLRSAVELDCDRRVLGRGTAPLPYADLLLRVGGRGAGIFSPALAEPARTLERRITMIVNTPNRFSRWSAMAFAGAAALLVGLACEAPTPPGMDEAAGTFEMEAGASVKISDSEAGATIRIRGVNALEEGQPLVYVDGVRIESGRDALGDLDPDDIERIEITKGEAALARYGEEARHGVIQIFLGESEVEGGRTISERAAREAAEVAAIRDRSELAAGPTFTPFTVRPSILNAAEVIAALSREYPPLLRDAGIGGTVLVHFLVDEEGAVRRAIVAESSGHEALDQAALRVAELYDFSPALNSDKPTPVWIQLPITFQQN